MQSLTGMRTELRQGTLEIDGITIESDIEVSLEPHTECIVNLEFEVRQGTAPTAMRLRTFSAEFVLFDNETENSIRLTDGGLRPLAWCICYPGEASFRCA